jgi:hypothetical protein
MIALAPNRGKGVGFPHRLLLMKAVMRFRARLFAAYTSSVSFIILNIDQQISQFNARDPLADELSTGRLHKSIYKAAVLFERAYRVATSNPDT